MSISPTLHTLSLTFDLKMDHARLPQFRGAFASLAGLDQDIFHNHDNAPGASSAYKQRYPLIQYRVHQGYAGVFGLNAGAKALERLVETGALERFSLNGKPCPLAILGVLREPEFVPEVAEKPIFRYRVARYLPFSVERWRDYSRTDDVRAQNNLLAELLPKHVLAFGKGAEWRPDKWMAAVVHTRLREGAVYCKRQRMRAFDLEFSVNARLPEGIGLGRKTAFGNGVLVPVPTGGNGGGHVGA